MRTRHLLLMSALTLPMLGCAPNPPAIPTAEPTSVETTTTYEALRNLPAPKTPVPVAVYSYPDLTGQFKPAETVSTNSRAVTQGAVWMLVKSLKDAAAGRWFKVIQRANLDNLLKERQIIRETRGRVEKQTGTEQPGLPSLLFAGVILEGGIIGYDSNTVTGGLGARYLGIGGDVQYRQDTVSIYLNAISSQTGEVLKSVMTRKTVVSYGVRGSVFKFVAFQKLLEGETGYTVNEPGQIALAQAIEHAVRSMIIEGALEGLWQFEVELTGKEETQAYLEDKEDDLLIGDATSGIAQALLTDEQLQKVADARKARRQRLDDQALRRQERQLAAERKKEAEEKRLAALNAPPPSSLSTPSKPIAEDKQLADIKRPDDAMSAPTREEASFVEGKPIEAADLPRPQEQPSPIGSKGKALGEEQVEQAQVIAREDKKQPVKSTGTYTVRSLSPEELAAAVVKQQVIAKERLAKEGIASSEHIEVETPATSVEKNLTTARGVTGGPAKPVDLSALVRVLNSFEEETKRRLLAGDDKSESKPVSLPGPTIKKDDELDDAHLDTAPVLKPAVVSVRKTPLSAAALLKVGADEETDVTEENDHAL